MAEVEETLARIQAQKDVIGTVVVNSEGLVVAQNIFPSVRGSVNRYPHPEHSDSNLNSTTIQYAGQLHQLITMATNTVREIDPQNDVAFFRIRSKKHEIMIAPEKDYLLIVIQNPSEWAPFAQPPVILG